MKVLVPVDGSDLATNMLGLAVLMAGEGEIRMVRVTEGPRPDAEAATFLEELREKLVVLNANVRWDLEVGDPADRILVIAKEQEPDYIVMATHGETGRSRSVRGSVAERVLRESAVPLLLANPRGLRKLHEHTFDRLLVPLDGSAHADQILEHVEHAAGVLGSKEVILLRVQPASLQAAKTFEPEALAATLTPQRERLEAKGLQVRVWSALGDEVEEILRAAEEADLVCLCTHGRSGVSRWWFGSVAEQVLRVCERPLLVVRPKNPSA